MPSASDGDNGSASVDLPICQHRGKIHEDGTARCRSYRAPKSPLGLVVVQSACVGCRVANMPHQSRPDGEQRIEPEKMFAAYQPLPCDHRRDIDKTETADLCGLRGAIFPVYWCDLHQKECVGFRICRRQEYLVCATCEDREPKTFRK